METLRKAGFYYKEQYNVYKSRITTLLSSMVVMRCSKAYLKELTIPHSKGVTRIEITVILSIVLISNQYLMIFNLLKLGFTFKIKKT